MYEGRVAIFVLVCGRLHEFEIQHMYVYGGSEHDSYCTLWNRICDDLVVHGLPCN